MMNEMNERIERFLEGSLTDEEKNLFSLEAESNPSLKHEMQLRIFADEAAKDKEMNDFRNQLNRIAGETRKKRVSMFMPIRRKWYLAAASVSIALVSGLGALFLLRMPPSPAEIYKSYYHVPKPIKIVRSAQGNQGDTFNRDMQIYASGNFAEASRRLLRYSSNPAARFYAAVSLMETGQFMQAESLLRSIADDPSDLFSDQAEWYLALCLLMNNNSKEAMNRFSNIANSQNLFNDKASEILNRLR